MLLDHYGASLAVNGVLPLAPSGRVFPQRHAKGHCSPAGGTCDCSFACRQTDKHMQSTADQMPSVFCDFLFTNKVIHKPADLLYSTRYDILMCDVPVFLFPTCP